MQTLDIIVLGLIVNASLIVFDFLATAILLLWPRHREVQAWILLYLDRVRALRKSGNPHQSTFEATIATLIPFARILLTFRMLHFMLLAKFHPVTYLYLILEDHKNRFGD